MHAWRVGKHGMHGGAKTHQHVHWGACAMLPALPLHGASQSAWIGRGAGQEAEARMHACMHMIVRCIAHVALHDGAAPVFPVALGTKPLC